MSTPTRCRISLGILVAALAYCAGALAQQQPPSAHLCEPPVFGDADAPAQATSQALAEQLLRLPQCQRHAPWLAAIGTALNQQGQYAEAAQYLERALLLDPRPPAVQIQYAVALAGSADQLSALQLLQALRTNPELAPSMRRAVEAQIARWTEGSPEPAPVHTGYLQARLGHDSNLLGAPDLSGLTLTLPGQTLQLPLDASYLSRPGIYRRLDAGWSLRQGPWQAAVNLSGRDSPQTPDAALQQIQAGGEYSGARHYASASAAYLQSRSGTRYRALGLSAGLQTRSPNWMLAQAGCRNRTGLEWQQRHMDSSPALSGHYAGLLWQHTCELGVQAPQTAALQAWQISVRWGRDLPMQSERPGGAQNQGSLRLLILGAGWGPRHDWLLDAELFYQRDTRGYSPLLQGNARRQLARLVLRAEYGLPLESASAWQLVMGVEWQRQYANLPLFQQKSHGAYVALRRQW